MELKNFFAQDTKGNVVPFATVTVCNQGTTVRPALYGPDGAAITNPFIVGNTGLAQFRAANGEYDVKVITTDGEYTLTMQCNDVGDTVSAAAAEADRAETEADRAQSLVDDFEPVGSYINVKTSTGEQTLMDALDQRGPVFDSVADMKAAASLTVGVKVRTLGYYAPGDGGGNDYEIVAAGTGSNYGFLFEQLTGSGLEARLLGGGIVEDKTAYVPSDYATLHEAVDGLSKLHAKHGATIDVFLESGYEISAPLSLTGGDYGHFTISSADSSVFVQDGTIPRTSFRMAYNPVFEALNGCKFPTVNILLDLRTHSEGGQLSFPSGYLCAQDSYMKILSNKGAYGALNGVAAFDGATVNCEGSDFRYSKNSAISSWSLSSVMADSADASFSEFYGVRAAQGASLSFREGTATDCARHACRGVDSATIDATSAILTNCGTTGVWARQNSIITAAHADCSGATDVGFLATGGSTLEAPESTANNCGIGYRATGGGKVTFGVSSATGCSTAISSQQGGIVIGYASDVSGSDRALDATASTVVCYLLNAVGCTDGIRIRQGSTADVRSSTVSGANISLYVSEGCYVNADDCTLSGAVDYGILAVGSTVIAHNADCSDCKRGFDARFGGVIDATSGTANNCTNGVFALSGGKVIFSNGVATGCARGVVVTSGEVWAPGATLTGSSTAGVWAEMSSRVNISGANCRNTQGVDDPDDVRSHSGSIVQADNLTGGTSIPVGDLSSGALVLG